MIRSDVLIIWERTVLFCKLQIFYMFEKLFLSCCFCGQTGSHAKHGQWLKRSHTEPTAVDSVRNVD